MRICFLGVRSVDPAQESSLGLLVEHGGTRVLLDCGVYTVQALRKLMLEPQDLDAVFISHDHADHCGGIPWLVATWLLASSRKPSELILASPQEVSGMRDYLKVAYARLLADGNPRRIVIAQEPAATGAISMDYIRLQHAVETWAALIGYDSSVLGYFPDCLGSELLSRVAAIGSVSSAVISVWGPESRRQEAEQFGFPVAREAGLAAQSVNASQVFVQHLVEPSDESVVAREMAEVYSGKIVFPRPLEWIEL